VAVNRRAVQRLLGGHPWIYRSDIVQLPAENPPLVDVTDERGRSYGAALYSSSSQIALRMLSMPFSPRLDLPALVARRLREAAAYRERIVHDSNAFRVAFSEADLLPGLVVDRFNDLVTFQVLTQAMDGEAVRRAVVETLADLYSPASIIERVEERIRELEALPPRASQVVWSADEDTPRTSTEFEMNGLRFGFEALAGQKTGTFLDQRENHAAAERYGRGRALDVCTYQGGFALHLNRVCAQVTGVDISREALEVAEANQQRNGGREIEWIEANAFDLLKEYAVRGERYETIVLDPPAFAKNKAAVEGALRGYKEMNLRALKMLEPGGVLVTCSCSFHVGESEFLEMLNSAAQDAHRHLRILETRAQSQDHPVLLGMPESHYLKCVIASVR
jgi:23S rRNA (cytosine1962-C5)-methyltransferase